jgi:cleavage stimulation factor subunit 2
LNNYDVGGRQLRIDFAEDKDAPEERKVEQNTAETITPIVQQMDPQQLAEVLSFLKLMTQSNPEQAASLLSQNPQIAYAVLQALVQMNLVDAFSMQRILQSQTIPIQPMIPTMPAVNPQLAAQQVFLINKQLVMQLMNLTPDQIQALPLEQQQQVIQLRAQLMQQ